MDSRRAHIVAPFHAVQECSELINLTVWMRCEAATLHPRRAGFAAVVGRRDWRSRRLPQRDQSSRQQLPEAGRLRRGRCYPSPTLDNIERATCSFVVNARKLSLAWLRQMTSFKVIQSRVVPIN